jgi:hypothetical protein
MHVIRRTAATVALAFVLAPIFAAGSHPLAD